MNRRAMIKPHLVTASILALALAACKPPQAGTALHGTDLAGATIGGSFTLIGRDGQPVKSADFAGKYTVVYFGYTFCPDACPNDVGVMMQGFKRFAAAHPDLAAKVQPMFISIDPARDTPERVGQFADAFGPPLIGLTGSEQQVAATAKAYLAYYGRGKDSAGGYLMDHSRIAYLMDPAGRPIEGLPIERGAELVAADLAAAVR